MQIQENLKMAVANVFPRPFDAVPTAGEPSPRGGGAGGMSGGEAAGVRELAGACQEQQRLAGSVDLWLGGLPPLPEALSPCPPPRPPQARWRAPPATAAPWCAA